jgi:predicted transcriptional regulator
VIVDCLSFSAAVRPLRLKLSSYLAMSMPNKWKKFHRPCFCYKWERRFIEIVSRVMDHLLEESVVLVSRHDLALKTCLPYYTTVRWVHIKMLCLIELKQISSTNIEVSWVQQTISWGRFQSFQTIWARWLSGENLLLANLIYNCVVVSPSSLAPSSITISTHNCLYWS